jgi:hypothetical protein
VRIVRAEGGGCASRVRQLGEIKGIGTYAPIDTVHTRTHMHVVASSSATIDIKYSATPGISSRRLVEYWPSRPTRRESHREKIQ